MKTCWITCVLFCPMAFSQTMSDEEIIRQARQASNEGIARKDVDAVAAFWWEDYVVITGRGHVAAGREANAAEWRKMLAEAPLTRFERTPSEIIISRNNPELAWESGQWKGFNTYSAGGRYSAQWKKKNGQWKLQAELFVALEK
ncbi:MAG: YybH family protein [Cyclobacteriaceae bacterium]|nr:nuclear transport factor 2 family protein [Flammeovirgaceae bacterium]